MFQFTRPRGARQPPHATGERRTEFQFTRPRGARPGAERKGLFPASFNSRAHGGRDVAIIAIVNGIMFQFTRPRGARHRLTCRI